MSSVDALLLQSLIVIAASFVAVAVFARAGLPAILGYLLAGLIIGPSALGLVSASDETEFLAELGVVFLLFTVGLEFSLSRLMTSRKDVLGGGSLQVAVTTVAVGAAVMVLGSGWTEALVLGGAVAMSSTAITLKQLTEQGESHTRHGRLAVGVLLFQDIATLPFLVTVAASNSAGETDVWQMLRQLVAAAIVLGTAAFISRPVFHAALSWIARTRSVDLFLMSVLLLALGAALLVQMAGLPAPIGSFVAGMVIGESDFRHRVEDDIRPFRDVLMGLFFVTVGMKLDLSIAAAAPLAVLAWIMLLIFGKAGIITAVAAILRWPIEVSARLAMILAHGGEFGLLLLTQAMAVGILDAGTAQPALVAVALTMGLAPILIQHNGWAGRLLNLKPLEPAPDEAADGTILDNHVVLCGYGRVGRLVALALETGKIAHIAIETDITRFREAKDLGHGVIFGDAGSGHILDRAGIERARLVVVTFDRHSAVERILHTVRQKNPDACLLVSAADDREIKHLATSGATAVFPENLAAGLALADQALLLIGLTQEEAASIITATRSRLNPELLRHVGV